MTDHIITGTRLVTVTGITYRQLDYWTTKGYLRPHGGQNPGSGHQREYTFTEARIASQMADLVKAGVSPESAAKIARKLHKKGRASLGKKLMIVNLDRSGA